MLVVHNCSQLRSCRFSLKHLKHLVVTRCDSIIETHLDCPSIVDTSYRRLIISSPVFANKSNHQDEDALKDWLWSFVEQSKINEHVAPKAAKAITALNVMGVPFIGKYGDLSGARIRGANLSGAMLSYTLLKKADLQEVMLAGAYLGDADFSEANLLGAQFGEFLSLFCNQNAYCVCYSSDGRMLAVGEGNNIILYRKKLSSFALEENGTYEKWGELKGHTSDVMSVAFSPDSKRLASSSSWGHTVRLWDTQSLQSQGELKGHTGAVNSVAFSPDGKRLASASQDYTVRLWDTQSLQSQGELKGHTGSVRSVAFSPDGKRLASGSSDKTVRLWDPQSLQSQGELKGHTSYVRGVAFSPDGKRLASGSSDKTVRLWDPQSFKAKAN